MYGHQLRIRPLVRARTNEVVRLTDDEIEADPWVDIYIRSRVAFSRIIDRKEFECRMGICFSPKLLRSHNECQREKRIVNQTNQKCWKSENKIAYFQGPLRSDGYKRVDPQMFLLSSTTVVDLDNSGDLGRLFELLDSAWDPGFGPSVVGSSETSVGSTLNSMADPA
ncbi:hypothetical protein MJO28_016407 [Puccinia striiformis f. sp. tritici]|uniref:Uncharacterized protein n=1 Tax=Puccinia striiformis f. sp. tritici TaxID=168172 RepID=A0ACC0DNG1_9BASI|nr:hypothetical protein MJO28_016407 [Puccinia striiformis f. sp. tritici]